MSRRMLRGISSRREFFSAIAAALGASCLCSRSYGWPPPGHQTTTPPPLTSSGTDLPKSSRVDGSQRSFACTLSANAAQDAQASWFYSSGNQMVDVAHSNAMRDISQQYGLRPASFFYDDSDSRNAFAVPNVVDRAYPDGTVVCGINLITTEIRRDGRGYAVPTILAHEMGHIMQFKLIQDFQGSSKAELHADYMAGWYLAREMAHLVTDPQSSLKAFFEIGDYEFNSPDHHGTP